MRRLFLASALLATPLTAAAAELVFDGHYRARGQYFNSLSLSDTNPNAEGAAAYIDHRLRLQPGFLLSDKVAIFTQIDVLPYVLWGDEAVQRTDPALGQDPLVLSPAVRPPTTEEGGATLQNLQATRVWAEIQTRYGQVRFGRMPLEWGAGMVFNAGNEPWQEFGDTVDRVQFTARVSQIYLQAGAETNAESFVSEADDVWGLSGSILYASEQASVGTYGLYRRYSYEDSTFGLMTLDIWGEADAGPLHVEVEVAGQLGRGDLSEGIDDVSIAALGAILEGSMDFDRLRVGLGAGLATGDKDPTDKRYRTFTFDADFNQTLFLFEEPIPTLAPTVQTDANDGREYDAARTGYALQNAMYLRPQLGWQLREDLRADARFFIARAAALPESEADQNGYGSELNVRIQYTPLAHFELDGTFGVFFPGTRFSAYTDDELGGNFGQPAVGSQILGTVRF